MKKTSPLFLFFYFLLPCAFAQNYVDLARFHYSITPPNSFDSIAGNTAIEDVGLDVTLPIPLNENNVVLTGFNIDQITTKLHPSANPTTMSTINLKIGYNKKHSEKWSGTYLFLPKISSDFKKITAKDYQWGGLILMKYQQKEKLKYNFGAYYNGELFGPFVVPLFGLYYQSKHEKLEINMTLPIWVDINYKLNNIVKIGSSFSAFVRSYHLGESKTYVAKKSNDLMAYIQFDLTKNILLQTKTGYSFGRTYKVYNTNDKTDLAFSAFRFGDDRTVLNPTFSNGLIFKIRLLYRFYME